MLESLQFVQGAVAKKDYIPALTHFHIANGRITGYNGYVALSSPIDLNLDATPRADQLIKAIRTCKDTVQLHMTPAGKLAVKSGKFKAFVECLEKEAYPAIEPEGEATAHWQPGECGIMDALRVVAPFIAEDASRPWARGVLFRGPSCVATNNIVLVEYWVGKTFPFEVNLPQEGVKELLRIGEQPISVQMAENSITFHFDGGRWLKSQLYNTAWPDISPIIDRAHNATKTPAGLYDALEDIKAFSDELDRAYLLPGKVATTRDDGAGASVDIELDATGCFNLEQLQNMLKVAKEVDLSQYPAPCLFFGDRIRGAIIGMRL